MTVNLKSLMTNPNLRDETILFICICIGLGVIFLHPKSLSEILFVPVRVSVLNKTLQEVENVKYYGISLRNEIRARYPTSNKKIGAIRKLILSIPKGNVEVSLVRPLL